MKLIIFELSFSIIVYFYLSTTKVTLDEFLECFERYGTVIDSVIMYDRVTTRSRGFGFITFEDPQICQRLIQMKRILMRSDKFVEIKEAQPRETTTHANLTYTLHNTTFRRDSDVGVMASNASFIPGMNHVVIGEPSIMDPSYMGMTYGHVSGDMPPQSPSVKRGLIEFTPYSAIDALALPPQFYASNGSYSNNTLFVPENTTTISDEAQTNIAFLQPPQMSPSHLFMSYGEPYIPNYGMSHLYSSSTMHYGNSDEIPPNQRPPQLYPMSMPYYNNPYVPSLPGTTYHVDRYRDNQRMDMNRPFYMASWYDYVPTSTHFFPSHGNVDPSKSNPVVEHYQNQNVESKTTALSGQDTNSNQQIKNHL